MLSYKSTTSGRKGLSRARLFIMKESFFCGVFHEEFLSDAREPVTGYRSSPCQWKGRSQLHQCSQSWGCCTHWGTLGKKVRLMLGRSCCEEEGQSRAGSLQSCTLPTRGHSDGVSLRQCHCRQRGKAKNIRHYYNKLLLFHKSWLLWIRVKSPVCTVV